MAFNINNFRSNFAGGGLRPTLFEVNITTPIDALANVQMPFRVKAANLPSGNLGTIEVPYFGRKIKVAGDRTFDPWTVTVIDDEDNLIRNALESWMSMINTHQGNLTTTQSASPMSYKSQAQVTHFGKTGNVLRVYNFDGIHPTQIAETTLGWDSNDTLEEFTVTFNYDWWDVVGGMTGDGGTNV